MLQGRQRNIHILARTHRTLKKYSRTAHLGNNKLYISLSQTMSTSGFMHHALILPQPANVHDVTICYMIYF